MRNYHRNQSRRLPALEITEYPLWSMLAVLGLIYLTPFVSAVLSYGAFLICLYRVVKYDERVFAVDYCLLFPLYRLFSTSGGFTFIIWLCLFASVWYTILRGITGNGIYLAIIILLNYLVLRMQLAISQFILCFGQLFMLCVVLQRQDEKSAVRAAKAFCAGILASSAFALVFRNAWQIEAIRGHEADAIWGTGTMRFMGLVPDPNYYMTMLIMGLVLLTKLKECNHIRMAIFAATAVLMVVLGILTYSKTFFLVLILLGGTYILWQFWSRKYFVGAALIVVVVGALLFLMFSEFSPFSVVIARLVNANDLSDLTTGRTDVYLAYWKEITRSPASTLLGKGMAAERLYKDTHNLYLEIVYYLGFAGLALMGLLHNMMIRTIKMKFPAIGQQHAIARYVGILLVLVLYFSLHGIFQVVTYGDFFLAYLSLMIVPARGTAAEAKTQQGGTK